VNASLVVGIKYLSEKTAFYSNPSCQATNMQPVKQRAQNKALRAEEEKYLIS
jgi:hypothetical protein